MINKTAMILCMECGGLLHKDLFKHFFSFKKVTKRWCDSCVGKTKTPEEFQKKLDANKRISNAKLGEFAKHDNTSYSQRKRANKKRFEDIEQARFSEEWDI